MTLYLLVAVDFGLMALKYGNESSFISVKHSRIAKVKSFLSLFFQITPNRRTILEWRCTFSAVPWFDLMALIRGNGVKMQATIGCLSRIVTRTLVNVKVTKS